MFTPIYAIAIDHQVYDAHRDGRPFTLIDTIAAVHGVRGARILRLDPADDAWHVIVRDAGSTSADWTYVHADGTEHPIRHRRTRWARTAWHALMQARNDTNTATWHPRRAHRYAATAGHSA